MALNSKDPQEIRIRFNTEKEKRDRRVPAWRILIDGKEFLAESIKVEVPSWTTEDLIAPNLKKWHISCRGICVWDEQKRNCTIKAPSPNSFKNC